jgi:hypothetical protein
LARISKTNFRDWQLGAHLLLARPSLELGESRQKRFNEARVLDAGNGLWPAIYGFHIALQ